VASTAPSAVLLVLTAGRARCDQTVSGRACSSATPSGSIAN
jgi:hypothetical protein